MTSTASSTRSPRPHAPARSATGSSGSPTSTAWCVSVPARWGPTPSRAMDAAALRTRFDALARAYPPGQHGRWAAHERSDALDAWFVAAMEGASPRVAVVALGGYGRRLQLPASDIDVLLVHEGVDAGALTELGGGLWSPLGDGGWPVPRWARTRAECVEAARARLDSCTAILDARVAAGSAEVGADAMGAVI